MPTDVEVEREVDGRWIAEVTAVPGAMAYGSTVEEAIVAARAIAAVTSEAAQQARTDSRQEQ